MCSLLHGCSVALHVNIALGIQSVTSHCCILVDLQNRNPLEHSPYNLLLCITTTLECACVHEMILTSIARCEKWFDLVIQWHLHPHAASLALRLNVHVVSMSAFLYLPCMRKLSTYCCSVTCLHIAVAEVVNQPCNGSSWKRYCDVTVWQALDFVFMLHLNSTFIILHLPLTMAGLVADSMKTTLKKFYAVIVLTYHCKRT